MSCHGNHHHGGYSDGYTDNYRDNDYEEWYFDDDMESLPYSCRQERANQAIRRFQVQHNRNNPPIQLRPAIKSYQGRNQWGVNYAQPYDPETGNYYLETKDELEFGIPNESEMYTSQRRKCGCYPKCHSDASVCVDTGFDCTSCCVQGYDRRNIPNLTPARLAFEKNNKLFADDQIMMMEMRRQRRSRVNRNQKDKSDRKLAALVETLNAYNPGPLGQIPWYERRDGRDF